MLSGSTKLHDYNWSWKVTTPPSTEPISNSDVKLYARIDGSSENNLIDSFIEAVRNATEKFLGRALITQTLTLSLNQWPQSPIELPRPPLVSVTEVRTIAEDDTQTTYDPDDYYTRSKIEPGELVIKLNKTAPINTDRYFGGYEIEFVAGYGGADDVPHAIKIGMIMWVADIYENRVPISEPPKIVQTIMAPYRVISV
jgi:uncharacterized phiE125 gp8 family phage protein